MLAFISVDAAPREGAYGGLFGGLSINNQGSNFDYDDSTHLKAMYDPGPYLGAFAGYRWDTDYRAELEISYRENSVNDMTNRDTATDTDGNGTLYGMSFMANFYRDVRWEGSNFVPYLGAGFGFMRVEYENDSPGFTPVNSSDEIFAYQVIAGMTYEMNASTDLFADYRYFATHQPKFSDSADVHFEGEVMSHAGVVGIRWMF
jgi:opacity protein-like surface antigen